MGAGLGARGSALTEISDEHDVVDLMAARDGELATVARDGVVAYEVGGEVGQLFGRRAVEGLRPDVGDIFEDIYETDGAPVGRPLKTAFAGRGGNRRRECFDGRPAGERDEDEFGTRLFA